MEIFIATIVGIGAGLFCLFFEEITEPGMILEKYGDWLATGERWKKPLGACTICFSFWVALVFTLLYSSIIYLPIVIGFTYLAIQYGSKS